MSEFLIYSYFLSFAVLAIYGLHRSSMMLRLVFKPYKQPDLPVIKTLPKVCVQLPLFNEPKVVERLLRAVDCLDYPAELLSFQVLDDSTDETSDIIREVLPQLRRSDSFQHIQRVDRKGFKAGALAEGLKQTDAELVAVFDADFIPDSTFLNNTVPYFAHSDVAYVQTRWSFVNACKNILTRAQRILIDAHFMIEHSARFSCCLLYTSPSPRDKRQSRMPSSA